jgi:eukaryotic-like serine/threonine-protein kinase
MDTKVADPLHGALLGGRYRVMGRLARGGMATVYQARDERLDRIVAVKLIHPEYARDPRVNARLAEEATTVARLAHPNVVAVYDEGTHDGAPYVVMEFVRGRTLREVLSDRHRLDPSEALAVIEQVLAALAVAHRAGLVHRDVKPENVLVAPPPNGSGDLVDAVAKVADFGLAHAAEGERGGADRLLATAGYVAPELVTGGRVDARADVYAAGIVLFEMLTGRVPFDGPNPEQVAWHHVERDVPRPSLLVPGLPASLDDLVARATRRDPEARPPDAGALLAQVRAARDEGDGGLTGTIRGPASGPTQVLTQPTMVVPSVDQRPYWARLPAGRAAPRAPRGPGGHPVHGPTGFVGAGAEPAWRRWWYGVRRAAWRVGTRVGRPQLTGILVLVGLLFIAGGWWFGFGRYTEAPSLVQLTRENATAEATRLGFSIDIGAGRYSEDIPIDTVIEQRPVAGGRIARGGAITLVLSLGKERYPVPDVAGEAADFATQQLKEHFVVERVDGFSDTLPRNYVVGTDPAANTQLKPGATVKLIIAKGPYPVHVPSVVGKPLAEAEQELRQQGFEVTVKRKDDESRPRDEVIDQKPGGGEGVASADGVKVTLTVANGPPGPPLPNVVGANCRDAVNALRGMGLEVVVNGNEFEHFFWTVRSQSPEPGASAPPGATVQLECA